HQIQPMCFLLRQGKLYQRHFQALTTPQKNITSPIKEGGHYLIAGDLANGLGMVFAQNLFEQHQVNITFASSTDLPNEDQWNHWLATHGPKHPVSMCVRSMMSLKQEGLNYQWLDKINYDFTLSSDWLKCLMITEREIDGIFIVEAMGDQSVCDTATAGRAEIQEILADRLSLPASLADALDEFQTTGHKPPDFVAVQSSLSAILGGTGFSIYAAASAALDALVCQQTRHASNTHWLSLNWDAVNNDIMSAKEGRSQITGSSLMDAAFTPEQAWDAFIQALDHKHNDQLLISSARFHERLQHAYSTIENESSESTELGNQRPAIETPYVAPSTDTEHFVVNAMGDLLGISKIGVNDDFFDLGGQSLLAIQAVTRLRQEYEVELPMRALLFDARTPASIAKLIDEERAKSNSTSSILDGQDQATDSDITTSNLNLSDDQSEEFEKLLSEVEELSPEEAEEQLN
ncbi:MAG: phosphopantetheine-binding protein, partial [Pseudomonadota bacterium]